MLREHDGQAVNKVIKLRRLSSSQAVGQQCAEGLKSRLSTVQAQDESLIARKARKPVAPVLVNQAIHSLFLKAAPEVGKEPDGD